MAPRSEKVDINKIFAVVDKEAKFKGGGLREISSFIVDHLKYTDSTLKNGTEGKVIIRFLVEKDGIITYVEVSSKKLGDGFDEEAIEAFKRTNKMWTPAKLGDNPLEVITEYRFFLGFQINR